MTPPLLMRVINNIIKLKSVNYCIIVLLLPPKPTDPSLVGLKSAPGCNGN